MTLDGGWGLIIATVVGVMLVWIGNLISGHFSNAKEKGDGAHERVDALNQRVDEFERDYLRSQTKAAETFARISGVERMETNIFAVLARLEAKIDDMKPQGATHNG
jgi:hypothetical protein